VIDAGVNRRLHVMESHLSVDSAGTGTDGSLSNAVCRVVVGEGAEVKHFLLQQKADTARLVESVTAEVSANGRYDLCLVQTGARSARVNVAVALLGESAACELNGVMVAARTQQLDLHSLIHHSVPSCKSSQKHKNVVSDSAECIFKGSIRVDKEAQQTTSDQICRSLLVTKKAKVKAMPSLQIQADDVVCSHGATVAKLNESEVFYLMSRGLDRRSAQELLLVAFPQDLVGGLMKLAPRAFQRVLDKLGSIAASAKVEAC
jgi:Fe-S cluster assembly protein SufD